MRRFTIMVPMGIGLLLGGVALGLGLRSQGAGADVVGEIEQQRLPNARLTNPVIEAVALRSESGPLKQLEDELALWIDSQRRSDPTLAIGVYYRDLVADRWIGVNEDEPFVPASLTKVGVMFHALDRLESDPGLLGRPSRYPGPDGMDSPDNVYNRPPAERMVPGEWYTFEALLERMISYSDNHAKEMILAGENPDDVERLLADLGIPKRVEDGRAVVDPQSYGALFRMLYNSSVFSRRQSELALELLTEATFDQGLRSGIPDLQIASKFGSHFDRTDLAAGTQLHECGIVYDPVGPYVLCVMTKSSLKNLSQLAALIGQVGAAVQGGRGAPEPASQ